MLDDEVEAEFFFQTEDGQDVVGSVRVKMDGSFLEQDINERFERDVSFGRSRRVVFLGIGFVGQVGNLPHVGCLLAKALPLGEVLLSLDEFGSLQRRDLHAC